MGGTACRSRAGVRTRPETCSHARPARTLDRVTGTTGNGRSPDARVRARGLGGANAMRDALRGSPPQHTSRVRSSTSPTSPIRLRAFGGRSVMPAPRGRPHPRSRRADWRVRASWTKKKFPGGLVARSEPSAGNHSPGPRHFFRRLRSDRPSSAPTPRSRGTSRESSHRAACADPSTVAGCLRRKRKTASCWAPASRASPSGSRARRPSPCTRSRRTSGAATRSWRIRCERLRARVIRLDERMSLRPPT